MSEATNPQPGVDVAPTDIERMGAYLEQFDNEHAVPTPERPQAGPAQDQSAPAAAQPESQADVLTPEDLPETPAPAQAQPEEVDFDIPYQGQTRKVATRAEAIELMSKGFDYTQKTQVLSEASRAAQERLQRAQEIEQVQQAVSNELGVVSALQQQLQQYQQVNWMQLAQDPVQYAQVQAQYNALGQAYQQAAGALTAKVDAIKAAKQQMTAQTLQQEAARLPDYIPEWRDPQKYEAGRQEMLQYLQKAGADMNSVGRYLDSAFAVGVLHKAIQYDKLRDAKAAKVKQLRTVPPVTRPGAAQNAGAANADQQAKLMGRLKKGGGQLEDAAALLASRWK